MSNFERLSSDAQKNKLATLRAVGNLLTLYDIVTQDIATYDFDKKRCVDNSDSVDLDYYEPDGPSEPTLWHYGHEMLEHTEGQTVIEKVTNNSTGFISDLEDALSGESDYTTAEEAKEVLEELIKKAEGNTLHIGLDPNFVGFNRKLTSSGRDKLVEIDIKNSLRDIIVDEVTARLHASYTSGVPLFIPNMQIWTLYEEWYKNMTAQLDEEDKAWCEKYGETELMRHAERKREKATAAFLQTSDNTEASSNEDSNTQRHLRLVTDDYIE